MRHDGYLECVVASCHFVIYFVAWHCVYLLSISSISWGNIYMHGRTICLSVNAHRLCNSSIEFRVLQWSQTLGSIIRPRSKSTSTDAWHIVHRKKPIFKSGMIDEQRVIMPRKLTSWSISAGLRFRMGCVSFRLNGRTWMRIYGREDQRRWVVSILLYIDIIYRYHTDIEDR
jgi:hypothetical protein